MVSNLTNIIKLNIINVIKLTVEFVNLQFKRMKNKVKIHNQTFNLIIFVKLTES